MTGVQRLMQRRQRLSVPGMVSPVLNSQVVFSSFRSQRPKLGVSPSERIKWHARGWDGWVARCIPASKVRVLRLRHRFGASGLGCGVRFVVDLQVSSGYLDRVGLRLQVSGSLGFGVTVFGGLCSDFYNCVSVPVHGRDSNNNSTKCTCSDVCLLQSPHTVLRFMT